jgi:hypothetical protein
MNILTCLCCPVPDHVKTGIGYISLFAIMDAESDQGVIKQPCFYNSLVCFIIPWSDEPRAKREKVQRQLDFFFNKPLDRERRYLLSIVT